LATRAAPAPRISAQTPQPKTQKQQVNPLPQPRTANPEPSQVALAAALVLVLVAWRFTSHLKVGGKIYSATYTNRRPDPPPALSQIEE
jgi:hypothetical protein